MKDSIGHEFMQKTRYLHLPVAPQDAGIPQPPLELPIPTGVRIIKLPAVADLTMPEMNLRSAVENRKTIRAYQNRSISMDELSYLLWLTQGVRKISQRPVTLRNVPSAGARHAFETYLLINRVEGLPSGLYRYAALEHSLVEIDRSPDINDRVTRSCLNQQQIANSAVTFFWIAVVERMYWRYTERGYRYLFLDAGHVCQNLYLAAETLGCGVCAIGAFDDDLLNTALGLDGETLFAVYGGTLGKRLENESD